MNTSMLRGRWATPWICVVLGVAVPVGVSPFFGLLLVIAAPAIALVVAVLAFRFSHVKQRPLWECLADAVLVSVLFTVSSTFVGAMLGSLIAELLGNEFNFR